MVLTFSQGQTQASFWEITKTRLAGVPIMVEFCFHMIMSTESKYPGSPRFLLYATPRSPFARRIRLALERLQISYELRPVDLFHPTEDFLSVNPLGLVPALRDQHTGEVFVDSDLILEALHESHFEGIPRIWPEEPVQRRQVRRTSGWVSGILTAVVARYLESLRPQDEEHLVWMHEHEANILRTLKTLRETSFREVPSSISAFSQADWDLVVMLEYFDLRWPELSWRKTDPNWENWLKMAQKVRFFVESKPPA